MIEIDWVEIPAGEFLFGLSERQAKKLARHVRKAVWKEEWPLVYRTMELEIGQQTLYLDRFYISRFPITWRQYVEFDRSDHRLSQKNVYSEKRWEFLLERNNRYVETQGDHPADTNWHFASAFCNWLGARLPTSAEWEKAARGTDGRLYPWGNKWDYTRGNFAKDRERWPEKTSPVDAYPEGQSPYGVMDLMGNTYEYTMSTIFDSSEKEHLQQYVICRGNNCDYGLAAEYHLPSRVRNRVTNAVPSEMHFGGLHYVGFRPVLDEWQKQAWAKTW